MTPLLSGLAADLCQQACQQGHEQWVMAVRHIETHEGAGRLGRAENIARCQHHLFCHGRTCQTGGVTTCRQAAPQIETTPWQQPGLNADGPQLPGGLAPDPHQTLAQCLHMPAIAATGQHGSHYAGSHRPRSAETGGHLQIRQPRDPVGAGNDITAAHRGRQVFGKTADTDHAPEPVQRRQPYGGLRLEITETILMEAVKRGGNRQLLHEVIRRHSMAAARRVKEEGGDNDLLQRLAADSQIPFDLRELEVMLNPRIFTGRAGNQVREFLAAEVDPLLAQNPVDEPGAELKV